MSLIMAIIIPYVCLILLNLENTFTISSQLHIISFVFFIWLLFSPLLYKLYKGKNRVCLIYHCNFSIGMVPACHSYLKIICWINGQMCKVAFSCMRKQTQRMYYSIKQLVNGRLGIQTHFIPMSLIFNHIARFVIPTGFPDTHEIFSKAENNRP